MSENIIKGLNVDDTIKYSITGSWAYFVFYLVTDMAYFPKDSMNAFMGILIAFSFGALSYHSFRSTLFIIITLVGDLLPSRLCQNHRLEDARTFGNKERGYIKARWYLCMHWVLLNDCRRIERDLKKNIPSTYAVWLSSIITMYLCGIFTILITTQFYSYNKNAPLLNSNTYYWIGTFLLCSAFVSQRLYEKRLFRHFQTTQCSYLFEIISKKLSAL